MTNSIPSDLLSDLEGRKGPALFITRNNVGLASSLESQVPSLDWTVLTKQDLRGWSAGRFVLFLWSRSWRSVVIEDREPDLERRWDLYRAMALVTRAGSRWLVGTSEAGVTAHSVSVFRAWPSLLSAIVSEKIQTIRALIDARLLTWKLRRQPVPTLEERDGRRIAVLRTAFWFGAKAGGSLSHALGVIGGMLDLGLEPRLWTTSWLPGAQVALEQIEVTPDRRPSFLEEAAVAGFNRTFLERTAGQIREFDPALVYHRHDAFSLIGLALARLLRVPLVLEVNASEVWAREAWSRLYFGGLARVMERTAFEKADRLVLISEELVPTVMELGGDRERIVVSANGVDVDKFNPDSRGTEVRNRLDIPENAVLCGFLGTFTRWHGVLFLAEQVAPLVKADPRLYFLFLGDGDLRGEVEAVLDSRGVSDHSRFTGLIATNEVPGYLATCDVLLSPHLPFEDGSVFFGSPTKLFEYMAAGRPVVASRLGQIARVVEHGETGLLYEPGNGGEFQEAVLHLASSPADRDRMGRRGREMAKAKYTWKANVERALQGMLRLPARS